MTTGIRTCLVVIALAGCRLLDDPRREDPALCPQTYEFGNSGCARAVVLLEGPSPPWPALYRIDVRAVPARQGTGFDVGFASGTAAGVVQLEMIRRASGDPAEGDTVSVWVIGRILDDVRPIQPGVPLPTFAVDSALRVLHVARPGMRPRVDTLRLMLRRPDETS